MSKRIRPRKLCLEGKPLENITESLNRPSLSKVKMSYSDKAGFPTLTNSPMSSLALNLSELSTRSNPRRRLSMSSVDTPPNGEDILHRDSTRTLSAESGCFSDASLDDSPTLDSVTSKRLGHLLHPDIPLEAFSAKKKTIAFRKFSSLPLPTMRLDSPTDFDGEEDNGTDDDGVDVRFSLHDATSQDSGLGFEHEKRSLSMSSFEEDESVGDSLPRLPSLDDVWNSMDSCDFKAPKGKAPKRSKSVTEYKMLNEDTCSPLKYSPVKSSLPRPSFASSLFSQTESKETEAASVWSEKSESDDGFQELFGMDNIDSEADDQLSSLMSAPLLHTVKTEAVKAEEGVAMLSRKMSCPIKRVKFLKPDSNDSTPTSRPPMPRRRCFQRSQSLDVRPRPATKRCEPPLDLDDELVRESKRRKAEDDQGSVFSEDMSTVSTTSTMCRPRGFQRCHSESEACIKSAVSRMAMEPNLIGDCSKPYCLPIIEGKHKDLKYISGETLSGLLCKEFAEVVDQYFIIDCRYPYEFEGGHIKSALNIYTKDVILDQFLHRPKTPTDPNKRLILIFHCEFSSERGPGLSRFLRRHDRESNKECYPFLHYPEIYLLEGGYKNFFTHFDGLCEPRMYRTMLDKNHCEDLRKFRAKSKSWAGEKSKAGSRNLRF